MAAQKVFVESNEEIVFSVEKVMAQSDSQVILVVPEHSALISSAISLKILSRQIVKSDKLVVLVSEGEVAQKLGEKAKLVVRNKVSDVDKATWDEAKNLKQELIDAREAIKAELLGQRQEAVEVPSEVEEELIKAKIEDDEPEVETDEEKVKEEVKAYSKPRLQEKVMEVGGITLVAGGDIAEQPELLMREKQAFSPPDPSTLPDQKQEVMETDVPETKDGSSLTGRDLTSMSGEEADHNAINKDREPQDKLAPVKAMAGKVGSALSKVGKGNTPTRIAQFIGIGLVGFFVFSYLVLPTVAVTLEFQQEDVNVNESVTADTEAEAIDVENKVIPAIKISKSSSASIDTQATGEGEKGEVAKGLVDIHNKTAKDVKLDKGTVLTDISTQKGYVLTETITIPKEDRRIDVALKAEEFGEDYNIEGENSSFKVAGYTTDEVRAFGFLDITGGTSEEITVASQEDIDSAKANLEEQLKAELLETLKSLISEDDILMESSEKFEQVSFNSTAKANDEVENFSVSLEMSISALKIRKSDLEEFTREFVKLENEGSENAQVDVQEPSVKGVKIDSDKATFTLSSLAGILEDVDAENIKNEIAGKNVEEANQFLDELEGVESAKLKYSPAYIPFFLQKVPDNLEKINVDKVQNT